MLPLPPAMFADTTAAATLNQALFALREANAILEAARDAQDPDFCLYAARDLLDELQRRYAKCDEPETQALIAAMVAIDAGALPANSFSLTLQRPEFDSTPAGAMPRTLTVKFTFTLADGSDTVDIFFSLRWKQTEYGDRYEVEPDGEVCPYTSMSRQVREEAVAPFVAMVNEVMISDMSIPLRIRDEELARAKRTCEALSPLLETAASLTIPES